MLYRCEILIILTGDLCMCCSRNSRYCGEVSLLQSGLGLGQWVGQFNARAVASPYTLSLSQTGAANGGGTGGVERHCQILRT